MGVKKFLILFLLLIIINVNAQTFALENNGLTQIEINESDSRVCENFTLPVVEEEGRGIMSLIAEFRGEAADNTYISVKFNDEEEQVFWPENLVCGTDCVLRVFTPSLDEENEVRVCLNTGGKTNFARLYDSSWLGVFETPVIEIEHTSLEEIVLGQRARMKINVKNTGTIDANIFVQFLAEDLRSFLKITSFDIVEGDASARTNLAAGEEKEFIYYIKPTKSSGYNLPSAVLTFENVFGENQKIYSNHPQLIVNDPTQIDLILVSEELTNNDFEFKLVVNNNWDEEFNGIITINPSDLIEDYDENIKINPNEEVELTFETKNLSPGQYSILAQVESDQISYLSNSLEFSINKKDYIFEIIFSFIAVIIGIGIFVWIYFQKA
jgi:hypothetical protein